MVGLKYNDNNGGGVLERCTQVLSYVTELTQETEPDQYFVRLNSFEHRSSSQSEWQEARWWD